MDKEQEKIAKARDAALTGALGQIERQFGKGSIMKMGDEQFQVQVAAIPTGALSLDLALGVGGMPRGRIVEVFGPESSGKTTLLYHLLAEAQKTGGICAFIDAEHAMDPIYAKRKLAGNLNRTNTLCIFTNQIREKVGVMFGSPETQPGGRALKFYSSQRLDIR